LNLHFAKVQYLLAGDVHQNGDRGVRVLLDAAASKDEELLLNLLREPGVEVLARAVRHPKYMQQWQAIPESQWNAYEEPDETRGRPPRLLEVANTVTHLGSDDTPVRTIVAREPQRCRKRAVRRASKPVDYQCRINASTALEGRRTYFKTRS